MKYRVLGKRNRYFVEKAISICGIDTWLPCDNKGRTTFSDKKRLQFNSLDSAMDKMNELEKLQK